jgi:dolichyl-phosphate-mannose-protein mannosyltransferase
MSLLLYALLVAGTLILVRQRAAIRLEPSSGLLGSAWAPVALGVASAALSWWIWGSLRQVPVISDEAAYLFQAKLFAMGRWTATSPPLAEFFEQPNLLLTPAFASKYPPGHSLLLSLGVLVGLPGLVPVLCVGLTGGLLFALARRVAGPWVALTAWLLWSTAPVNVTFRPSYFSEVTTGALWLVAWWALLEWRDSGRLRWLITISACIAWTAITRPLTAVALAVPVAVIVMRSIAARRAWRDLALAAAVGVAVLGIIPLWSARTTGDWRTTPLMLHTREYLPFVHLGFGADSAASTRPLPPDMEAVNAEFRAIHGEHTVRALPETLTMRTLAIGLHMWRGWRVVLVPFAVVGLFFAGVEGAVAFLSALLLVGAYLLYAHPASWTLYYLELQPLLAFLTALGLVRVVALVVERVTSGQGAPAHVSEARVALAPLLLLAALLPGSIADARVAHTNKSRQVSFQGAFRAALDGIPAERAIVFVRYGPRHNNHYSLIGNDPDLERARVWTVYDRGSDDARLMALARDRAPFLFDEAARALVPLAPRTAAIGPRR